MIVSSKINLRQGRVRVHSGPPRSDPAVTTADIDLINGGSDDEAARAGDQVTCEQGLEAAGRGGWSKIAKHTHASIFFYYHF